MFPDARPVALHATPLDVLARWPADRPVTLLHSGRLNSAWSRYSVIAEPHSTLVCDRGRTRWIGPPHPRGVTLSDDPLRSLDRIAHDDDALYLGYLGYELAHTIEPVLGPAPTHPAGGPGWPDAVMHRCPAAWVYDHQESQWLYLGPGEPALPPASAAPPATFHAAEPVADHPRAAHESRVQQALDYIAAGDVFQVNLAQRFTAPFSGSPRALFAALAEVSPAWYGAYVELPGDGQTPRRALASTSPELFLKLAPDRTVTTRPIKGTRPAGLNDPGAADALRNSAKDAAELNMIIDLLRNDLGRVCSYGSVKVSQLRTIETHPTVHHGVATITGSLHPDKSLRHLLRATFPGGSITGAPKVRAMQIIRELEAGPRGPYCGAIGMVRGGGGHTEPTTAQFSIAIRTLLIDPGAQRAHFHVGGGIVADSHPADEYEETLHKAQALRRALTR